MDDLAKIREENKHKVGLRESGQGKEGAAEILVGMTTCGIATGAKETLEALTEEIKAQSLENVRVVPVGCIGYCFSEPTVQVNVSGEKPVFYSKVDEEKAKEIVQKHIMNKEILKDSVLETDYGKA